MGIFSDIAEQILDMDDAVETVYYTPKGGSETALSSHVFRDKPKDRNMKRDAMAKRYVIELYFAKSSIPDVNVNSDSVRVKIDSGDTVYRTMVVREVIKQDAGSYTVGLT